MNGHVAIARGLAPDRGRELFEAWVKDEQPAGCDCSPCSAVREAMRLEQERLDQGAYRDAEGFWVFSEPE